MKSNQRFPIIAGLILGLIVISIYIANLWGNFWLTGWDNLHPEFNFLINIRRALFSSWQEYQGLGLPAGHGHASELIRELLLFLVSFLVNPQSIRKIYTAIMLFIGPIGVFFLLRNFFLKEINNVKKNYFSFAGCLFYLLNLVTVQIFYIPYEAFIAHYGFLPWMVFSVLNFLNRPSKKNLFYLFLIHIVASSQFYIPTLFFVYITLALFFIFNYSPQSKQIKPLLSVIVIILITNINWLIPFINYLLTNLNSQTQAYLNLLYSEDIYLKNLKYGTLESAILLKGFLFGFTDTIKTNQFGYLMNEWRTYYLNNPVVLCGYLQFFIVLIGIVWCLKNKKNRSLIVLFILFFSLVANRVFPLSLISNLLHQNSLFHQVFRNPFTKIANSVLLLEALFFSLGLKTIDALWVKKNPFKIPFLSLGLFSIIVCQIIYLLPIWKGYLVYPQLKKNIPDEYFQLFDYFKNKEVGRIANFPQPSANGWENYRWGYRGSGLIWYGIEQPILDRAFDVWQPNNENYYWELSQALYSHNEKQFINVLNKYQINWLIVDKNFNHAGFPKSLYLDQLQEMLNNLPSIKLVKSFNRIYIYQVSLNRPAQNFIYLTPKIPNILPRYQWNNNDQAYYEYQDYYSSKETPTIYYPFRSLFNQRQPDEKEFDIEETENSLIFKKNLPEELNNYYLVLPELDDDDFPQYNSKISKQIFEFPKIYLNQKLISSDQKPKTIKISRFNNSLKIVIPKINGDYYYDSSQNHDIQKLTVHNCDPFNQGSFQSQNINDGIRLISLNSNNCASIFLPQLTHRSGYMLIVNGQNISGKPLLMNLINDNYDKTDISTYLNFQKSQTSYLVVSPKEKYGQGYRLQFDNISLGDQKSINDLYRVKIYPFPYNFLTKIAAVEKARSTTINNDYFFSQNQLTVSHPNPAVYTVKGKGIETASFVVLSQSYHPGWIAIANGKMLDHVKINNWANGWKLNKAAKQQGNKITIVFWPQYLEFFGLVLLILIFFLILSL